MYCDKKYFMHLPVSGIFNPSPYGFWQDRPQVSEARDSGAGSYLTVIYLIIIRLTAMGHAHQKITFPEDTHPVQPWTILQSSSTTLQSFLYHHPEHIGHKPDKGTVASFFQQCIKDKVYFFPVLGGNNTSTVLKPIENNLVFIPLPDHHFSNRDRGAGSVRWCNLDILCAINAPAATGQAIFGWMVAFAPTNRFVSWLVARGSWLMAFGLWLVAYGVCSRIKLTNSRVA